LAFPALTKTNRNQYDCLQAIPGDGETKRLFPCRRSKRLGTGVLPAKSVSRRASPGWRPESSRSLRRSTGHQTAHGVSAAGRRGDRGKWSAGSVKAHGARDTNGFVCASTSSFTLGFQDPGRGRHDAILQGLVISWSEGAGAVRKESEPQPRADFEFGAGEHSRRRSWVVHLAVRAGSQRKVRRLPTPVQLRGQCRRFYITTKHHPRVKQESVEVAGETRGADQKPGSPKESDTRGILATWSRWRTRASAGAVIFVELSFGF